ncbi:MAG: hypothetical protein KKA79_10270 [Nanoarchaeota archaeon]|nr:hypothetical protein [Nanoarchaeota archaeon]
MKYFALILLIILAIFSSGDPLFAKDSDWFEGEWFNHQWSPDGEKISCFRKYYKTDFTDVKNRLYVFNSDGTDKTLVADDTGEESAWSTDSKMLLYGKILKDKDESISYDIEHSYPIQQLINYNLTDRAKTYIDLITVDSYLQTFSWILNGKRIVYRKHNSIYMANVDGSHIEQIVNEKIDEFRANYSTGIIVYSLYVGSNHREIYVLNIEDRKKKKISNCYSGGLWWNSQGDRIIFEEFEDPQRLLEPDNKTFLCVIDNTGSNKRKLLDTSDPKRWWNWSPEGRRLVYYNLEILGRRPSFLYIVDVDTGRSEKIFEFDNVDVRRIKWMPDGQKVIFTDKKKVEGSPYLKIFLYMLDLNTKKAEEITAPPDFGEFSVSPDGSKIFYYQVKRNMLVVYDLLSGQFIELTKKAVKSKD